MKNKSSLADLSFLRRPNLGLAEVEALLDSLPQAALLINTSNFRVALANGKATELTAFTRNELRDLDLNLLFPGLVGKDFFQKMIGRVRNWDIEIIKHNGPRVEVQVTPAYLDPQRKWMLLTLEPVAQRQQKQVEDQSLNQLWEILPVLANAPQDQDMESALERALEAGQVITSATLISVYQGSQDDPSVERRHSWGEAELLPRQISNQDYVALRKPHLWTPGNRPTSSLHRAARAAKLTYLATAPLGLPEAMIGVVVLASNRLAPSEFTLPFLQVMAASITTIIQQKELAESVDQSQVELQRCLSISSAIQEAIQDGVVVIAPDLTIQDMNFSAEMALGYKRQEVVGKPYHDIFIGIENLFPLDVTGVPDTTTYPLWNVKLYRRNGQAFLANIRALPLIVDDQLESLVVLIQDLSQEEDFRVRTQQLEQRAMLGELTAIFAHEVRNPINNISIGLQYMEVSLPEDNPNREIVTRLQAECDRLDELMKQVLAYARPVDYEMEAIDIGALLKRLLDRWRARLSISKIETFFQVEEKAPFVQGDARALEQVFINLISNAMQAMSEKGGMLTLKVGQSDHPGEKKMVEISVADTGIGIPEDIQDRIFEPFFTTHEKGTGLGLAITNRIINSHKGRISLTSVPTGTVFHVYLPIDDIAANQASEAEAG